MSAGHDYEEPRTLPDPSDAFITDMSDGLYGVSLDGRVVGTFPRWNRAAAALYLAEREANYWPDIWHVNDHGNVELYAFDGFTLNHTGIGYV